MYFKNILQKISTWRHCTITFNVLMSEACFKRRILHKSNSIAWTMYVQNPNVKQFNSTFLITVDRNFKFYRCARNPSEVRPGFRRRIGRRYRREVGCDTPWKHLVGKMTDLSANLTNYVTLFESYSEKWYVWKIFYQTYML